MIPDYKVELCRQIDQNIHRNDIVRNFYILRPTCTFENKYDYAEKIMVDVGSKFDIQLNRIMVCGSAKLGFSLSKNTQFRPGDSDLDLAIVDSGLYSKIFDIVLNETNNYNRKNLFINDETYEKYLTYVSKGVINPKYMPNIDLKRDFLSFFSLLSSQYRDYYKSISVCVYLTEYAFKRKQQAALSWWISNHRQNLLGKPL